MRMVTVVSQVQRAELTSASVGVANCNSASRECKTLKWGEFLDRFGNDLKMLVQLLLRSSSNVRCDSLLNFSSGANNAFASY